MGNVSISCCRSKSPRTSSMSSSQNQATPNRGNFRDGANAQYSITNKSYGKKLSIGKLEGDPSLQQSNNLQHISEREPDDSETDPSSNPFNRPIFATRSSFGKHRANSLYNDSYSSSNNSTSRKLNNTPLASSQDHGYNSGASTNLTSQYESQLNDSFETSASVRTSNNNNNNNNNLHQQQKQRISIATAAPATLLMRGNNVLVPDTETSSSSDQVGGFSETNQFSVSNDSTDLTRDDPFSTNNNSQQFPLDIGSRNDDIRCHVPKSSSCSTIFIDDSTISQPNLIQTIRCVSLAIYYHIKNRTSDNSVEIFDETVHPLRMPAPNTPDTQDDFAQFEPEHEQSAADRSGRIYCNGELVTDKTTSDLPSQRAIYSFVKTLFKAAQLTSEYAITTLVYLERLMTYAEMDLAPRTWRRMFLGAILLSSKVWEDQAVWNVDYAQILEEISVEDINELERQFLELIQFNMNVPSSVYAKYYFHLRTLALQNGISDKFTRLTVEQAKNLEAFSRVQVIDWQSSPIHRKDSPKTKRHSSLERLQVSGQAKAVLM